MDLNKKTKLIILLISGIVFNYFTYICYNSRFISSNCRINLNYNNESDLEDLEISSISETIHIDGNSGWVAFKAAGNCTGNGTYYDPYLIEDLIIDTGGFGIGILIENSDFYFRIENCTIYNSGGVLNAGIHLLDVINGQLIDNNCSNNWAGIYLRSCSNSNISGNIVNDNNDGIASIASDRTTISDNSANNNIRGGIFIYGGDDIMVLRNIANGNDKGISLFFNNDNTTVSSNKAYNNSFGIHLEKSNNTIISDNTAINNSYGIYLEKSNFNNISRNNLMGNENCIYEDNCKGNIFEDNEYCDYKEDYEEVPGYNLYLLLGFLFVVVIIISKKNREISKI